MLWLLLRAENWRMGVTYCPTQAPNLDGKTAAWLKWGLQSLFMTRQNVATWIIRMAAGCILTGHPGSKMEIPAEGKRWRKKYVSLNLVHSYWANLGGYREIGDARAHNDLLDDRARHHRINHRWRRYPHVFEPYKRTISSRRPHFFHTWRDPGSLRLL